MGILLVVDECFLDFVEQGMRYTLKAQLSRYHNLFILKAFTKRYAMAGVRLGYTAMEYFRGSAGGRCGGTERNSIC